MAGVRVTGGSLSRREIRVPKGIRPTQDKVRAAIFNSLGAAAAGARVLDLYAGSGAFGIEAWSRGAMSVCWVESDRRALSVLKENVAALCGAGPGRVVRQADVAAFLRGGGTGEAFDIVLADPPYDREGERRQLDAVLLALEGGGILAPGGILVFEQSAGEPVPERPEWEVLRDRTYGDTRVLMFRRVRKDGTT